LRKRTLALYVGIETHRSTKLARRLFEWGDGGTRWLALGSVSGAIASRRCRDWVKIKNIAHPAIERAMLIALSKRQGRR
jgi:hypothetical protein